LLARAAAEVMGKSVTWHKRKLKWVIAGLAFMIGVTAISAAFHYQFNPVLLSGNNRAFEAGEKFAAETEAYSPDQFSGQRTEQNRESGYQTIDHSRDAPYFPGRDDNAYSYITVGDRHCIEKEENLKALSILEQSAMLQYFDYARECYPGKLLKTR
jgi:hypothetical protein